MDIGTDGVKNKVRGAKGGNPLSLWEKGEKEECRWQ